MDRDEALRLLTGGPDGIREWNRRREQDEEIPTLSDADLSHADLSGAVLSSADLSGAQCGSTVFGDVDLSETKGLESIVHQRPSTVGVDTLVRSRGRIPEAFLRGCGVPEVLIAYLPSLIAGMEPIQFYSCFISHSTIDKPLADRLHGRMVQEGLRVWYAPHDLRGGQPHDEQIDQAISMATTITIASCPCTSSAATNC